MTHDTDCRVLDEYRDEVDEIAQHFAEGDTMTAERKAGELGWELLGQGVERAAFRVSTEQQEGEVEDATHDAPCVVKFHKEPMVPPEHGQNAEEYAQFQQFPDEMTDTDDGVPAVVPINDHAEDFSWVSMPEAGPGGNTHDMVVRLARQGWKCQDLHNDNLGTMHGVPVVLDYGMECSEASRPEVVAEEVEAELTNAGATVMTSYEQANTPGWVVEFWPGDRTTPNLRRPVRPSRVEIDGAGEITSASFVFGGYNINGHGPPGDLDRAVDVVASAVEGSWMGVRYDVQPSKKKVGGKMVLSMAFIARFGGSGVEMPPEILADLWDQTAEEVHEEFPDDPTQGSRPHGTLGAIEHEIEQSVTEETTKQQVESDIGQAVDERMHQHEN